MGASRPAGGAKVIPQTGRKATGPLPSDSMWFLGGDPLEGFVWSSVTGLSLFTNAVERSEW